MSLGVVLVIILLVLALGATPQFGLHSGGYGPSGILGAVLVIVLILLLLGKI